MTRQDDSAGNDRDRAVSHVGRPRGQRGRTPPCPCPSNESIYNA